MILHVVKYLMEEVRATSTVNFAIQFAAREGHLHLVKYLMSLDSKMYGIDPAGENN